jgi:polar amino acid transport system substrate-binding protein
LQYRLTIILLVLLPYALYAQTTINITNGEWEPYLSEYSHQYGIDSHVITESFKLEGIAINWGFFPWKRSFELAKSGQKWHASAAWWASNAAKSDFLISDPISTTSFVFFHLKSKSFDWQSMSDLNGLKVGATLGYDYGREFTNAVSLQVINQQLVTSDELNYKKLLNKRINIFPNDLIVGYSKIRSSVNPQDVDKFTHHPLEFEKKTLHLIISKKTKNAKWLMDSFNTGLRTLKESGRYDQIFKDLETGKYDKKKIKWQP